MTGSFDKFELIMKAFTAVCVIAVVLFEVAHSQDRYGDGYHGSDYQSRPRYGNRYQSSSYECKIIRIKQYYLIMLLDKKVVCPKLADPQNGKVKVSGFYPGQKATYSCDNGFVLIGLVTRICLKDGKWSQEAPTCRSNNKIK